MCPAGYAADAGQQAGSERPSVGSIGQTSATTSERVSRLLDAGLAGTETLRRM